MAIIKNGAALKAYKGDYKPVNLYRGVEKIAGWDWQEQTGTDIAWDDTYDDTVEILSVTGKSEQAGTPSPSAPVPINSAGGEIVSRGKNYVSNIPADWEQGTIDGTTGLPSTTISSARIRMKNFMAIPSETICASYNSDYQLAVRVYDASYNFIAGVTAFFPAGTHRFPGAKYMKLVMARLSDYTIPITMDEVIQAQCQIEMGATVTPYVPYFAPSQITLPALRSVGDTADTLTSIGGGVYEHTQRIDPNIDNCTTQSIYEVGEQYILATPITMQITPGELKTYPYHTDFVQTGAVKAGITARAKITV